MSIDDLTAQWPPTPPVDRRAILLTDDNATALLSFASGEVSQVAERSGFGPDWAGERRQWLWGAAQLIERLQRAFPATAPQRRAARALAAVLRSRGRHNSAADIRRAADLLDFLGADQ